MISREELCARRCVEDLILVIEQVPLRAAVRAPMTLDHVSIRWVTLWTLLRWERRFLLLSLEDRGIDLDSLARDLDELIKAKRAADAALIGTDMGPRALSPFVEVHVDHLLYPLLDQAAAQSRALGHYHVGTEHLLLALVAEADEELAALFRRHGMGYEDVRAMIRELVPPPKPEDVVLEAAGRARRTGRSGAPALASWDRQAVGVPRRFGMAIVLLIMAMYAVLFAAMKLLAASPGVFIVIAVLFTGVGLGQMLLFGGRYPRAASVWVGGCLFPLEILATYIYLANTAGTAGRPPNYLGEMVCSLVFSVPLGAGFGYLAGALTAGVFLLIERYAKPRQAAPDVDVLGLDDSGDAGPDKQATDDTDKTDELRPS
jgi:hypothetical protein